MTKRGFQVSFMRDGEAIILASILTKMYFIETDGDSSARSE
jgi:hypothetical protein